MSPPRVSLTVTVLLPAPPTNTSGVFDTGRSGAHSSRVGASKAISTSTACRPRSRAFPSTRDPGADCYAQHKRCTACRGTGFFYVENHGLDAAFLDETFAQSRRFFELPLAEKEKIDLLGSPGHDETAVFLSNLVDTYFETHADSRYDLWKGGHAKSNTASRVLWQDAWGSDWAPVY